MSVKVFVNGREVFNLYYINEDQKVERLTVFADEVFKKGKKDAFYIPVGGGLYSPMKSEIGYSLFRSLEDLKKKITDEIELAEDDLDYFDY